nr:MAG TPA: Protein involved in formate dehydrogenase formation [Caudoviricetes sp.]
MTLDYQDHHCKMCGKYDKLAWVNGGYCDDCFKLRNLAKIRESIEEGEPDTFSSDYVVCPYCGDAISDEDLIDLPECYEDGQHEITCDECGREFEVITYVSYSWKTSRKNIK